MMQRLNGDVTVRRPPGTVGMNDLSAHTPAGVAVGDVGAVGPGLAASLNARPGTASDPGGGGHTGSDNTDSANKSGVTTGPGATGNCMSTEQHNASMGEERGPEPGTPPNCLPCTAATIMRAL